MPAEVLSGKPVAEAITAEVQAEAAQLARQGLAPLLVSVMVGQDEGIAAYVRMQAKVAEQVGVGYRLDELPASTSQPQLADHITSLNHDAAVTGVILQMPLPDGLDARSAQDLVAQSKDVDGISPANLGLLAQNRPRLAPCTAMSAMALIRASGRPIKGAEAVIVGRSDIVGKPLALMLMAEHATPTLCHTRTRDLAFHTRRADILVAAAGRPRLIKGDMVKPDALVIDVGINYVDGKMVGDVDFEAAAEVAGIITPVPGGVGPCTVASLMRNVVEAAKWQLATR